MASLKPAPNVVRERALQRLDLIPRGAHPDVAFLVDRHGFGMDRFDDGIRRRRQEAIDKVWASNRLRLRTPVTFELGPDASEGA
jgi:hypothetical protein